MNLKYFSPSDSKEECHRKYKILANIYHPDKNFGDNAIMAEINNEYNFIIKGEVPINADKKIHKQEKSKLDFLNDINLQDILDISDILFEKNNQKRNKILINLLKKHKIYPE